MRRLAPAARPSDRVQGAHSPRSHNPASQPAPQPPAHLQLAPLHGQVARLGGARRQHHRVVLRRQLLGGQLRAHVRVDHEAHALLRHQVHAALRGRQARGRKAGRVSAKGARPAGRQRQALRPSRLPLQHRARAAAPHLHHLHLVGLHVGHAIHHEAADPVGALVHRHRVACLVELVSGGQARGAAADDGHALACRRGGRGGGGAARAAAVRAAGCCWRARRGSAGRQRRAAAHRSWSWAAAAPPSPPARPCR